MRMIRGGFLVKVTDHGLAMLVNKGYTARVSLVEVMTNSAGAAGPTRWMAPESILRRIYSKKNDVWAFGVLLYEGWTLVMIPYYRISDDREVARMVVDCNNQTAVRIMCILSCSNAGGRSKGTGRVCLKYRPNCKRRLR